jgi:hypothetical protein
MPAPSQPGSAATTEPSGEDLPSGVGANPPVGKAVLRERSTGNPAPRRTSQRRPARRSERGRRRSVAPGLGRHAGRDDAVSRRRHDPPGREEPLALRLTRPHVSVHPIQRVAGIDQLALGASPTRRGQLRRGDALAGARPAAHERRRPYPSARVEARAPAVRVLLEEVEGPPALIGQDAPELRATGLARSEPPRRCRRTGLNSLRAATPRGRAPPPSPRRR